jgi:hypothetical protein
VFKIHVSGSWVQVLEVIISDLGFRISGPACGA